MRIFGREIIFKKNEPVSVKPQIRHMNPQGPMTVIFQDYIFRKVSGDFYEMLREGIATIDGGIRRLISLNGTIKIIGDNMPLVEELEDFCRSVPVGDTQAGIHAFYENTWNETFEQGFSFSEFTATPDMKDIAGMRVADSKNIVFRRNTDGAAVPWYRYQDGSSQRYYSAPTALIERIITATYGQTVSINGINEVKLNPANKIYFSIGNENGDPYGVSIMRSMEFVSQILVTLQNSILNSSERFGDPMYHGHIKSNIKDLESVRKSFEDALKVIVASKRNGGSGDIVTAGGNDGDVKINVIGHDGQLFTYDVPLRHVLEQIVSKFGIPAWMLGIYWSTTERMATLEVESALQDAKIRQLSMIPQFIRLFSTFLRIRGRQWKRVTTFLDKPGDWGFVFETPNLRDILSIANANFLNAQADLMRSGSASNTQTNLQIGQATVDVAGHEITLISKSSALPVITKELRRPSPWPDLDKIEFEYENKLKDDWAELQERTLTILKIRGQREGKGIKAPPADLPGMETFFFTEDQRNAIMQALKNLTGSYDWSNADSPVRRYYGQSYSAGLIQAAYLLGKDRPILDIIQNREVYEEMMRTGFQLVKDTATRTIVDRIIPEMEAHMTAGSNPLDVARRLEKLFRDQNSDWERLARSEMSMAAERAKLDEWKEWKVKMVEFTPAPDACPICMSLRGDYSIGKCPLPVQDTHPRCRCSTRPASSEA